MHVSVTMPAFSKATLLPTSTFPEYPGAMIWHDGLSPSPASPFALVHLRFEGPSICAVAARGLPFGSAVAVIVCDAHAIPAALKTTPAAMSKVSFIVFIAPSMIQN